LNTILILFCLLYIYVDVSSPKDTDEDIRNIAMVNNIRIYSKNGLISVVAPENRGIHFIGFSSKNHDFLVLKRAFVGEMVEKVRIEHYYSNKSFDTSQYLNKKNLDKFEKDINNKNAIFHLETNRGSSTFTKAFIDYVDGVKCRTFLNPIYESFNDTAKLIILTQKYMTYCSFYGLGVPEASERVLEIFYEYHYSFESEIFKNSNKTEEEILKDIQNQFKQDIKEIFDSIKIHTMNREKMQKEGLLYDKKYEIREDE